MTFDALKPPSSPGFIYWGLSCLIIAIVGFWPSYVQPSMSGSYVNPTPMMPLHVTSTALWLVLLISQPGLVYLGRTNLHRGIGMFGAVVAATVVYTGIVLQVDVMAPYFIQKDLGNAVVTPFFRLSTMFLFAVCVAAAVGLRSKPDWHKRLMFLGTFCLLEAPLSRIYANVLAVADENAGVMGGLSHMALMAVFVVWDRKSIGRWHPVSRWGALAIFLVMFGTAPLATSDWWTNIAARLAGM